MSTFWAMDNLTSKLRILKQVEIHWKKDMKISMKEELLQLEENISFIYEENSSLLFSRHTKDAERTLRGLRVRTTYRRTLDRYKIRGVSKQAAENFFFEISEENDVNYIVYCVDYFKQKYGLDIYLKLWPCVDVGKTRKPRYVPLEFHEICEGQVCTKISLLNRPESSAKLRRMS